MLSSEHLMNPQYCLLSNSGCVCYTTDNWFIYIYIPITYLEIISAFRLSANPSLVMYCSTLAAEIRKRNQVTFATRLALRDTQILHMNLLHAINLRRVFEQDKYIIRFIVIARGAFVGCMPVIWQSLLSNLDHSCLFGAGLCL